MKRIHITIIIAIIATGCTPNFNPETDSELADIILDVDITKVLPDNPWQENYRPRLTMYCFNAETDSLSKTKTVYPSRNENVRLSCELLDKRKNYIVTVIMDYEEKKSDDYYKQRWYQTLPAKMDNLHLVRIVTDPTSYDVVGRFSATMHPDPKAVAVSLSHTGKPGCVYVHNPIGQNSPVTCTLSSVRRFAPFNQDSDYIQAGTYTSSDSLFNFYYISDGTSLLQINIASTSLGTIVETFDVSDYLGILIDVNAGNGKIQVQEWK